MSKIIRKQRGSSRQKPELRFNPGEIGSVEKVIHNMEYAWDEGFSVVSAQGGTRSGKTYNIMIWCILKALKHEDITIGITRKTSPTIYGTIFQDFRSVMKQLNIWDEDCYHTTNKEYTFPNGSVFRFFPVDDAAKQKGRKNTIVWLNEATEFNESDFNQLNWRTEQMAILDYNPDYSEDHWLNRINADRKNTHFFITTYLDNRYLEPRIIAEIEKLRETNLSLWKMFGEGKRCKVEGLIFPTFDTIDRFPQSADVKGLKTIIAIDYGYSADPTAILKLGFAPGVVYIKELCYQTKMFNDRIADILNDPSIIELPKVSDNSEPKTIAELQQKYHVRHLKKVNKGGRSSHDMRIASIHRLQSMRMYVTTDSPNVLRELRNYCFAIDSNGNPTNEPIRLFDHCMDALRYGEMTINHRHRSSGIIIHK